MATGFDASGVIIFRDLSNNWYRLDLESLPEEGKALSPVARLEHEAGVGWTVIGDDIYCAGRRDVKALYKRKDAISKKLCKHGTLGDSTGWEPISCDRKFPLNAPFMFAIDRKIYVLSGHNLPADSTYGGEVYDLDTKTWNGVASSWGGFYPYFSSAPAARVDKDTVVFYSFRFSSLLFYNATKDQLYAEVHPSFAIFSHLGVPPALRGCRHKDVLSHVRRNARALVYDSTLYWISADLHLYGYDFVKRRWLRSNSLEGSFWPLPLDTKRLLALPMLLNLDNNGTFLAIHTIDSGILGMASLAVCKEDDSLTVSVNFRRTIAVDFCIPAEGVLRQVTSSLADRPFTEAG